MKLLKLTLHNFRKFKDLELEFPEGIIGLVGSNGSGKSTIIEAIGWAIYGNRAARTSRDQVKRMGAKRSDECWVKLAFELEGTQYEVFRILTARSSDARVKVNGVIAASSAQGATAFLEKKLRMDYDSFYTSIVARQQELNTLSDKSPAERKKSMLRMLGVDVLDEAIRRVREDRRHKEKILEHMEKNLKDIDELENKKREGREAMEQYSHTREQLMDELESARRALRTLEEELSIEKERAKTFKALDEKRKLLTERQHHTKTLMESKVHEIEELEKNVQELEELQPRVEEYETLSRRKEEMERAKERYYEKRNLQEQMESLTKEIASMVQDISALEKQLEGEEEDTKMLQRIVVQIEETESLIKQREKAADALEAERRFIAEKKEELEQKAARIRELGAESDCPTCGRPLGEKYEEIIADFENSIRQLEKEMQEKEREIERIEKDVATLKNRREDLLEEKKEAEARILSYRLTRERAKQFLERKKEKESSLETVKKRLAAIGELEFDEEELRRVDARVKDLLPVKNRALILENEVKKIPALRREVREIEKELGTISGQLHECIEKIDRLDFDVNRYEELEKTYAETRDIFHGKKEEIIRIEGKMEHLEKEMGMLEREIEEQHRQRNEIRTLRKNIANLEALAGDRETGLLNSFKNYLISKIGPMLSYHASHFFSTFTNGKYREIEIGENYDIFIYDGGERFELERFSGGEKDLANLSLRLAISQLIAQKADALLQFIALDEIFGSQDRERKKNVLNALAELKNQFRQILLITHIEEIKDSMEYLITVYEDENGISHARIE